MEIKRTGEAAQYIKALNYGQPGSGKTRFAGTMALKHKTLILSAESGLMSVRNIEGAPAIDFVEIKKIEDIEEAYHFLKNGKHDYKAVAIDSLTEIQKICKDHIMGKKEAMEIKDWGSLALRIERIVRAFRDLPMHVVITALEESEVDKITGEITVVPALQGSVQKMLPAYFDIVLYFFCKEVVDGETRKHTYNCLTKNSGKYIAKDRSGRLPMVVQDPSFGKLEDLIFNNERK